ncbi:MAG: NFACT family protein [Clostridia bacterium]|nr:NFACT family protein [Clostridia bacterium]
MAFDAGMVGALAHEISEKTVGARVEKVYQPEKDELVLSIHTKEGNLRLSIAAGANNPRIGFVTRQKENPATPYMFCILARKHLTGARILSVKQIDFERVIEIALDSRDEMGFFETKYLYAEIMGKYSNLVLTDKNKTVLGVLRPVDFTVSAKRQLLGGLRYELPPQQEKRSPLALDREDFLSLAKEHSEMATEKWLTTFYLGISSLVAREIAYRSVSRVGASPELVYEAFSTLVEGIRAHRYTPTVVYEEAKPIAFSFTDLAQYGEGARCVHPATLSEAVEAYFDERDNLEHSKKRASDLFKMVMNARARIAKKLALQEAELAECAKKDDYKRLGDLITANIYQLKRGMTTVKVIDYYDEAMPEIAIELDARLTPSQNAQIYYKKYNKAKNAEKELAKQIAAAKEELRYIDSVADALTRAVGQSELDEIRRELVEAGYGTKIRKAATAKGVKTKPYEFRTSGGYRLLCGKNNLQNDQITFRLAAKDDWWFHVKNAPGSHVVMIVDGREEPSEKDFTEACALAAFHSSVSSAEHVEVDYTKVRHLKKPAGAKPGFVTYTTYYSAYVKPCDLSGKPQE